MVRSSGSSHWTFTQLDKELHYHHGDMGMHLRQGSPCTPTPALELPSSMAAENGEWGSGGLSARNSKIIFDFTNVESMEIWVCARITLMT